MRLLITRPVADAQALAAQLEARGHSVLCAGNRNRDEPDAVPDLAGVKGLLLPAPMVFGHFSPSRLPRCICRLMLSVRKRRRPLERLVFPMCILLMVM